MRLPLTWPAAGALQERDEPCGAAARLAFGIRFTVWLPTSQTAPVVLTDVHSSLQGRPAEDRQRSSHVMPPVTFGVRMSPSLDAGTSPERGTLRGLVCIRDSWRRVGMVRAPQSSSGRPPNNLPALTLHQQSALASGTYSHGFEGKASTQHPSPQKINKETNK